MERRDFVKLAAAALSAGFLSGCAGKVLGPSPLLPPNCGEEDDGIQVMSGGPFDYNTPSTDGLQHHNGVMINPEEIRKRSCPSPQPQLPQTHSLQAVSRKRWHAQNSKMSRMHPMGTIERVTIHHEGNPQPNFDSTPGQVARSLRQIQNAHFRIMAAGDIAYHFIIDRQGLIWQGRELCYQGAHSKGNNSHNVGIMCLGNFDLQRPTGAQLSSLESLCSAMLQGYGIPPSRLYGHRELRQTACPGNNLYPYVKDMRSKFKRA